MPVSKLRVGDRLRLADGSAAHVTDVRVERGPPVPSQGSDDDESQALTTYNFEVADWHTYFVGQEGVWVHNLGDICQKAFSIFRRHVDDLGESPETAYKFVEKILTKYMTDQDVEEGEFIKHLADVFGEARKEAGWFPTQEFDQLWTPGREGEPASNMMRHFIDHVQKNYFEYPGGEFPGTMSAFEYLSAARQFVDNFAADGVERIAWEFGGNRYFVERSTRLMAIQKIEGGGGPLRTFFRRHPSKPFYNWAKSNGCPAQLLTQLLGY